MRLTEARSGKSGSQLKKVAIAGAITVLAINITEYATGPLYVILAACCRAGSYQRELRAATAKKKHAYIHSYCVRQETAI